MEHFVLHQLHHFIAKVNVQMNGFVIFSAGMVIGRMSRDQNLCPEAFHGFSEHFLKHHVPCLALVSYLAKVSA